MEGVMEVVKHSVYDLKYLSSADISYNPALGTGQLQVRDIHYVDLVNRTTWEFCQLLDKKYLASKRRTFDQWKTLAVKFGWIKSEKSLPADVALEVLETLDEAETETEN
jgi:hypothetical protein